MKRIRYKHGRKADDYRNQKTTWIMQQNSSKLSKIKNLFPKPVKITQCNWRVGVGFDSLIWQGHILDLLDWSCKTTIKRKFCISRKRKLPFPHLFRRKTPFRFCFHFRQKITVSISVPQISVFIFIFSFRFRFFAEKSESFRSTFIPTLDLLWFGGNMKKTHRIEKFYYAATIHPFDSYERCKGKLEELFLWISLSRQNVQEMKHSLIPHSFIPMHKERGKVFTCYPFLFLSLSYSFNFHIL
jgi:hypothetical protein